MIKDKKRLVKESRINHSQQRLGERYAEAGVPKSMKFFRKGVQTNMEGFNLILKVSCSRAIWCYTREDEEPIYFIYGKNTVYTFLAPDMAMGSWLSNCEYANDISLDHVRESFRSGKAHLL